METVYVVIERKAAGQFIEIVAVCATVEIALNQIELAMVNRGKTRDWFYFEGRRVVTEIQ